MRPSKTVEMIKRLLDVAIGILGCFTLLFLFPILAILIKWETPGPVIYQQIRIGKNRRSKNQSSNTLNEKRREDLGGSLFTIYKFRTMGTDAEKSGPQLWTKSNDLRVTRVGRILRALHLDELPQFYNILKGEMSFIGPRPERPFFTKQYMVSIPNYSDRTLHIQPGLTGLAQIVLGYDDTYESVVRKTHYDLSYRASLSSFFSWIKMESWIYWHTLFYIFHVSSLLRKQKVFDGNKSKSKYTFQAQSEEIFHEVFIHQSPESKILTLRGKSPSALSEKLGDINFSGIKDLRVYLTPGQLDLQDLGSLIHLMDQVKRLGGTLSIKELYPNVKDLLKEIKLNQSIKIYSDMESIPNFLTIDVECWFQAYNLREVAPHSMWHRLNTHIVENVEKLLGILEIHRTQATFFVLGWVADHFPEVIRMIDEKGHHIGVRGYYHNLVVKMTPNEFEDDLYKTINAVSKYTSQKINTSRASNFSITKDTLWALEILSRYGIENDSSIYPVYRGEIGYSNYPNRFPHRIILENQKVIKEIPLSIAEILGKEFPIGGGGFFRLYPYWYTARFLKKLNDKKLPGVVYIQPWELDPKQPKQSVNWVKSFRHYVNLETTETKLHKLLEQFKFGSIEQNLKHPDMEKILARYPVYLKTLGGKSEDTSSFSQKIFRAKQY